MRVGKGALVQSVDASSNAGKAGLLGIRRTLGGIAAGTTSHAVLVTASLSHCSRNLSQDNNHPVLRIKAEVCTCHLFLKISGLAYRLASAGSKAAEGHSASVVYMPKRLLSARRQVACGRQYCHRTATKVHKCAYRFHQELKEAILKLHIFYLCPHMRCWWKVCAVVRLQCPTPAPCASR